MGKRRCLLYIAIVALIIHPVPTGGLSTHSLQIVEPGGNSTRQSGILRLNPNLSVAMEGYVEALRLSTKRLEAAIAAIQSSNATTERKHVGNLKAVMRPALDLSFMCIDVCLEMGDQWMNDLSFEFGLPADRHNYVACWEQITNHSAALFLGASIWRERRVELASNLPEAYAVPARSLFSRIMGVAAHVVGLRFFPPRRLRLI